MYNHNDWTEEYQKESMSEGWGVFAVDGNVNHLEIQKVDEMEVFDSDAEVINFLKSEYESKDDVIMDGETIEDCFPDEFRRYRIALEITGNL